MRGVEQSFLAMLALQLPIPMRAAFLQQQRAGGPSHYGGHKGEFGARIQRRRRRNEIAAESRRRNRG